MTNSSTGKIPRKRTPKKTTTTTAATTNPEGAGWGTADPHHVTERVDAITYPWVDETLTATATQDGAFSPPAKHDAVDALVANITDAQTGDVNAERLTEAMQQVEDEQTQADRRIIEGFALDEPRLRALLAQLQEERAATEERERERGKTPLALVLEVVGCEFATTHFPDLNEQGKTLPTFDFNAHPCVQTPRKQTPDQDCRMCIHHTLTRLGATMPLHMRRYARHGMVIPIRDDAQADALAYFLKATGMMQLRHVENEMHFIETQLEQIGRIRSEVARRETERAQRGPATR